LHTLDLASPAPYLAESDIKLPRCDLHTTSIERAVWKAAERAGLEGKVSPDWLCHNQATHAPSVMRPCTWSRRSSDVTCLSGDDGPLLACPADGQLGEVYKDLSERDVQRPLLYMWRFTRFLRLERDDRRSGGRLQLPTLRR